MPRVRVICQNCGRKLSYLEIAPWWKVRATCPVCGATTTASLDSAGQVVQITTPAAVPTEEVSTGVKRPHVKGKRAG